MKKTLIAVAMAMFVSTGFAAPAPHAPTHHNNHIVEHHAPKPAPKMAHHHPKPAPHVVHHHHYNHTNFGDVLIAFAILATAM